jgi:hypothetical protein
MAAPSTAILRLDYSLSYGEFNLAMNRKGYVGLKVFPAIAVDYQSAQFLRLNAGSMKRPIQDTTREESGEYKPVDFTWDKDSYSTVDHGLRKDIDDRNLKKWRDMINQELVAALVIQDGVLSRYEQECATAAQSTANVGTYAQAGKVLSSGATAYPWSDYTNAIPITDMLATITAIENASGTTPDSITLTSLAVRHLRQCAQFIDRVKYAGNRDELIPDATMIEMIKAVTGLQKVNIASGFKNTAAEVNDGTAPVTFTRLWDSAKVLIHKSDDGMGTLESPVLRWGNTVQWVEEAAANQADDQLGLYFEAYRNENVRGETFRGRTDYQIKIMHANTAGMITSAVA